MKFKKWLEQWDMVSLKITTPMMEMEWKPNEQDKTAAWELYVELITRVTTNKPGTFNGDEIAALSSIHSLFDISREIIKKHGRHAQQFTKLAIIILNQIIRPFTSKWHKFSMQNSFADAKLTEQFKQELFETQSVLITYSKMLADLADVEDLT